MTRAPRGYSSSSEEAGAPGDWRPSGRVREYWIEAQSYATDAAPVRFDALMGEPITTPTDYVGLRYRAYAPGWLFPLASSDLLGPNNVPGPVLRAEVGDLVRVHFRNGDRHYNQPHSMHPHGVFYDLDSDGSWAAVRRDLPGAAVPPGGEYVYEWQARKSSVGTWIYHDHSAMFGLQRDSVVVSAADFCGAPQAAAQNARTGTASMRTDREAIHEMAIPNGLASALGLIGMVIVSEPGAPQPDREFFVAMHELHRFDLPQLWPNPDEAPDVNEQLYLVNGRTSLANTPVFEARVGEHVRWNIAFIGTPFRSFRIDGRRWWDGARYTDRTFLNAAQTRVIEYIERQPGTWLYGDFIHGRYRHAVGRYVVKA